MASGVSKLHSVIHHFHANVVKNRAALAYLITMAYIVLKILNERRPMFYYSLSASLFILGQLAWFLLGRVICKVCLLLSTSGFTSFVLSGIIIEGRRFFHRYCLGDCSSGRPFPCVEKYHRRYASSVPYSSAEELQLQLIGSMGGTGTHDRWTVWCSLAWWSASCSSASGVVLRPNTC